MQTGVAGVDEINLFTTGNPQARAVYESVTGKTLPKTNAGTREMLYRESGMNRVESARAETKSRVDEVKGLIGQDMGKYYESAGQEAFSQAFGDVNIGNAAQVDDMINTFDDFYRAGRNDIGYDTVISYQNPVHSNVSSEVKKAAWEAGQQDKILATETAKGLQMKIGETAKKNRSQRKMSAYKGRLYSELSNENKAKFTASQQAMLRALARVFNIDIHIVDAVENGANGYYKDGKMYISMEADRALEYVFAHEITHHMQQYAPEEYNELKELVRKSWAQQGGIDEAVDFKVAQYAQHGVELNREDALDEILADSTYEVLQDETFVEELCKENRSIAQSILNAIKDVLKKLRSLLADGDRFTPAQNAQLLSNLDILKEFEKKWTDGLLRSVENRDAVGTVGTEVKVVKLSAKESKKDSIRLQIERNLGELNNMSPVASVKTKGYKGKSDKQVIDAVMANFKKRGYGVDRKGFGFISLEEEFINRSLNYLNTEAEYAAFDVLPQVLKNGKEIRDDEHKGRGHNTVTFAAPVVINGKAGIMGAVVMRTKGNRYKTHRIVMPDGSQYIFEQEKTEVTTSGMTGEKIHGEGPDIASAINDSISQTDKKDNGKSYSFKGIDDENVKYSIREDDPPKKTVKGYKVFVVKSGKLYPPMVANPGGADTPVGVWLDADEGVRAGESKTGRPQVKAGGKGTQGGSGKLAYRPGWHLGEAPMATQFAGLNKETGEKELFPENFVWAECEAAADHDYQDEAMSYGYSDNGKFRHAYAGLPRIPKDGMYRYRTNPDPSTVPWIISGSMKVTKVLSDAEVDEILRSNATVSETAPEDKSKLWVDSSDGDTLKYWYGSKKEWRKAPVVRKGGKKTLEELGITNDTGSNATQFSLKDSDGRELSEQQQEYFKDSKIRDEDGNLLVLYHQTENDFTIFDTRREGAGTRDNGTPYGIFLKPTSKDIGLRGKKQMALYADIKNPLKAKNRADLDRILKSDKEYAEVREELDALDTTYKERFEKAKKAFIDFITAWRKENPDAKRSDIYDDPEFNKIYEAEDAVVEEWTAKADDLSVKCKETINAYLNEQGYDGVILEEDAGSFGRSTKAYIALDQQQVKNIDNSNPTSDPDIRFSLKNEKLSPDARIPYTAHQSYISVKKNDNAALKNLQDSVRKLKRGTYENKATGYKADINRVTIGKILNPSGGNGFNRWSKKYIDNLNAATQLPELFENAVYVDTKENQKSKKANQQIQGYHHFVAPIYMDGKEYRVRIVAREKQNSDVLYIVETEIMPIKNGSSGSRSKASYFVSVPFDISIPELVNGVKIYDYNMQKNDIYNHNDIKYSMPDETSVIDYMNEQETEFADLTGFRDYEVKAKQVRQQTYGELVAQVEKLKNDKMFTKGKVLDERSVREEINDMIVTLMSYSESYNSLGVRKKTDHNLVREGVNAAKQIFTAMKKGDVSDVVTKAELAAQQIVENLKLVEDTAYVEYKDLRDYLRTTRMVISEEDAADIPDFKQFKKSNFGRIRIVSQNGIPVDTAYQELMERYPELFSDEITHPADMLRAIADVRESLEPYDIMLSAEETEQLVKQTAQDLIDIAATGKAWKSWADKKKEQYDEKLKMLKQRQREALRDVKKKERDRAEKKLEKERQKGKERLDKAKEKNAEKLQREKDKAKEKAERQKDSKERKRLLAGIEQNRKWLSDRLSKPTDDKHIPEGFRTALADLLSKIDMQSQKSKALEEKTGQRARRWVEMDELKARFAEIAKEDGSGSFEYDGYVFEIMDSLAEKLGGRSVDEASTQELQEFDVLMKYIANGIKNYNKAFDESIKEEISQLALESVDSAKARQAKLKDGVYMDRSGILGGMDTILNESMVTPRDFFERIGGGLEKTFMGLRRGMDRHVDNMTKTREFFEGIFRQYNNKKKPGSKIEEWRNGKQVTTFDVQGGKIRLTPAQVMSLYCLAKREQAMGHILGSGIVASRVDSASKIGQMLGAKIQTGGSAVMIGMEDIVKITGSLTQEQKAMADQLQSFLNDECSQWGNEVSMRLYGYRKFTEENYFPIKSADAYLDSNFDGREVSERIKNFGFTKGTVVNANNPIMIDDIFSVVADHINKMSLYNAFAAPISDFTRVYNYKSRDDAGKIDGSVKSAVEQAYGKKAINYISNFMADLNNQTKMHTDGILGFVNKSLANYKKSAIGGNLRVALQQPTAVARSFVRINPKYFANGKVNIAKNLRDMKEHCQIARWKSWGFSQVDMARDIDQIMMNNEWSRLDLATMQIYGFLDDVTWSTIWAAVRTETKAKYKNVQVDSEEFYRICNERASEIFDKTQVVDSVFHRSQAMRNKQVMSKMVTSFMAEPTRTFNMMRTEFLLAKDMWQEGNKAKAVGKMMRATSVFTFNAALCAGFAAAADALRGRTPNDDDDDSWLANFLANFWDNVNPLNMIPVVKDIWGYADGWDASNMAMEGWEKLVQGTMDFIQSPSTDGFLNMCDGLGYVTGLPVKNVRREFKSALKALGIESFAAEEGKEESADKKSIMDKIFGSFNIKDGSRMDNFLNHFNINLTDEEKAEKEYKDQVSEIEKDVKDLSGSEKEEKIWSEATKNYTKYIEDGDMESVTRCRRMLESLGGDVDKFDESVKSKVKTALKKNIGEDADPHKTWQYRNYLAQNGMNAEQISSEIVAKSDTAKEFQIALCMDDEDAAVDSLSYLIAAGISYEDMYVLFVNRTKAIKASDFSTGEFAYPVSGEITSAFGGRESPGGIGSTDHKGIDIGVAMNSDVAAADGGKVTYAGWNGGYGYMVRVDHGNGRVTEYAHLNGYYVQKGQSVKKGEVIALSGSTGNSTGPHLHFGVKQNGTYVDPMIYF
ncbi:MAG: peptidoglycan DD-metalloendopeptidase family protein [Eubacteriales bacterium]|nr:peptidoglycan DD-metalloendopeptidase family protein [Eubacteriales bacterium]